MIRDERIVERARAGDPLAWDALYARHGGLIQGIARRHFLKGGAIEDLIQEGRIGLFRAVNSWRPERGGGVWQAFAAMCIERQIHTAIKTADRGKHGPLNHAAHLESPVGVESHGDTVYFGDTLPGGADPADVLELRDELREALEAIARLTPLERTALVGIVFEGYTYDDLASEHGITAKAVDNAISRARRKLAA